MSGSKTADLDAVISQPPEERAIGLTRLGRVFTNGHNGADEKARVKLVSALAELVEGGVGDARHRVEMGEVLGLLGDPRIVNPTQEDYWVPIAIPHVSKALSIAKFPVTNAEFHYFVGHGAYEQEDLWTPAGWAWLQSCSDPWPVRAGNSSSSKFIVPNQPVVGVTWFEASAFAKYHESRLPRFDERLWAVRGEERRPYPWGSPFGDGNANTKEEVVGRPCAVGLFVNDRTPEGVRDLAGNVAEWAQDGVAGQQWIHPGAWDQPSMAAWAKARFLESPDSRWAGLGFRLAKD